MMMSDEDDDLDENDNNLKLDESHDVTTSQDVHQTQ